MAEESGGAGHEGTPLWEAVDAALAELEGAGELVVRRDRAPLVARICARLAEAELVAEDAAHAPGTSRARFAAYLERVAAAGAIPDDWQQRIATRSPDSAVEEARRQAAFVHLRLEQGTITMEKAAEYLLALARGLRGGAS